MAIDGCCAWPFMASFVQAMYLEQGLGCESWVSPSDEQNLIAELSHQINSPLAAIRNAIYLAASQTDDPALLRYLEIADEEVTTIVAVLQANRAVIEQMSRPPSDAPALCSHRAAASPGRLGSIARAFAWLVQPASISGNALIQLLPGASPG